MHKKNDVPLSGKTDSGSSTSTNSNRQFPVSSTPICSSASSGGGDNPSLVFGGMQTEKSNLKLPVGPLANSTQIHESNPGMRMGGIDHPNVTIRDKYDQTISPIPNNSGTSNPVRFTGTRRYYPNENGDHGSFSPAKSDFSRFLDFSFQDRKKPRTKKPSQKHSNPFPYPNVMEHDDPLDAGTALYDSLKILELYKRVDRERTRIFGGTDGGKHKDKLDDIASYEFTPDMFASVNTEAFLEAMYLIFRCYDQSEADLRFRDCWPIYETKIIGVYRRVCLEWLKEIIHEHPQFFADFKIEALSGLLVNPGGERFISLMRQLCRLVMFKAANAVKDVVNQQVMLPPNSNADPEITNRQIHLLHHLQEEHFQKAIEVHVTMLKEEQRFAVFNNTFNEIVNLRINPPKEDFDEIEAYIKENPEAFRDIVGDNLNEWKEQRANQSGSGTIKDLLSFIEDGPSNDPLVNRLEEMLKARAEEIYRPVSLVENVIEDNEKIWHILDMDKTTLPTLDLNELDPDWATNEEGEISLETYIANISKALKEVINNEFLNSEVSPEMLAEFERLKFRAEFLTAMDSNIKKEKPKRSSVKLERLNAQVEKLKHKFEGFDWSLVSGIHEPAFNNFEMSPMRVFDINRQTGRTPAMNTFLDSSFSTSSADQIGMMRQRRCTSLSKPGSNRNLLLRKSTNDAIAQRQSSGSSLPSYLLNSSSTGTPVSSHPSSRSVSLIQTLTDSGSNTSTPTSSSIRKSVSFLDTSSVDSGKALRNSSSRWRDLQGMHTPSPSLPEKSQDVSIIMNDSDESLICASVNERVRRLLDSVAGASTPTPPPYENEHSRSRAGAEAKTPSALENIVEANDEDDVDQVNNKEPNPDPDRDECMSTSTNDTDNLNDEDLTTLISSFENISVTEDWADMKGIMETSHTEMLYNSDSE